MIFDEKAVKSLWNQISKIARGRPSVVFDPDEDDVEKFELLVKLGKMVKNKYGSGYSIRNDIGGVYGHNRPRRRRA